VSSRSGWLGKKSAPEKIREEDWSFGQRIDSYEFPVFNERQVRAAAGLLFLFGFSGLMSAGFTGDFSLLRAFGAFFMLDMFLRLFAGFRWSPSMALGGFFVRNQVPEWVDAVPKKTAWSIGLVMVIGACFMMGWLNMQGLAVLALCGLCLSFLFAEAAFGFCAGCWLHLKFAKTPPRLCSGGVCEVPAR
jgi:hypothetical protein